MDFGLAPPIRQALDKAMADGLTGYLTPKLLQDLGEACAQWQQVHHGWAISPDDVNVMPVSYTHLDVYKRQVWLEPREVASFQLDDLLTGGTGIVSRLAWFAHAPHLPAVIELEAAYVQLLGALGALDLSLIHI